MSRPTWNTPGLSLYSIPLAYFVGILPARKWLGLIDRTIGFDNTRPRLNISNLYEYPDVGPEISKEAKKTEGAYQNSLEILPLWIGAVLAGNLVGLDSGVLNLASASFIGLRVLYNYIYMNQKNERAATLRSITWLASIAIPMALYIRAGNKLQRR